MAGLSVSGLRSRGVVGPCDLAVAAGECLCVSGPSGAGKTLLLRAIADLDPHEGEVSLNGESCNTMRAPLWRRRVGLLPAESAWWQDTVGPHFADGEPELLRELGFPPEVLGWQVRRLSTGERQRLALARLLANEPEVLLLDEPTASLDPENVKRVEDLIARYRRQHRAAVVWVSHDPEQIARVAGRELRLHDGSLEPAA
jgi:ABC-type iron transport system FetAB ATPase subunit